MKRIVIIGAGAAGLTAAETLKQQGYQSVVVLEKSDHAGGKCCSPEYQGNVYELGAGFVSNHNRAVLKLVQRYQVPTAVVEYGKSILVDAQPKTIGQKLKTVRELLTYLTLVRRYRTVAQPGWVHVDPAVCVPFAEFAKQHHMEWLAEELALYFTGFGYDYFATIPAAYVLKYYSWPLLKARLQKKMYIFPQGIQHLWTTVAKQHDVRYHTVIQQIKRADTITITTTEGELECDDLIIASPLDEALEYLDAHADEHTLFSKIEYCDYRTYAVRLDDFPKASGFLPGNYTPDRMGSPVYWYHRHADTNLYTFYVLGDWKITDEQVLANIVAMVKPFGGTIVKTEVIKHWKYFPHVNGDVMRSGFFDQVEKLQGQHHTYYVGEVMNFSTVGLTAEYAERLVQRFF
ncbi:MAG: FAD-dependent oxidoreductase [Candidatus Kerfeldbacteria bacterium]|nr:FAD-dependent oxidoreductase [Candidatus Kerfeldbacteria bacterium]